MSPTRWAFRPVAPEDAANLSQQDRHARLGDLRNLFAYGFWALIFFGLIIWNDQFKSLGEFCTAIQPKGIEVMESGDQNQQWFVDQGTVAPPEYEIIGAKDLTPNALVIVEWQQSRFLGRNKFTFVEEVPSCKTSEADN